ncbi:MAG: PepSY-associated TM helix domain-containing protein [Pseudomonadota bacterium]
MSAFPKRDFRASMTWLHSWAGIIPTLLFFAVFWMGTLSVFDKEIDRWMQPESRYAGPPIAYDLDASIETFIGAQNGVEVTSLFIMPPKPREPYLYFYGVLAEEVNGKTYSYGRFVGESNEMLGEPQSLAGSGFIFPFHFKLHIPGNFGYYLIGAVALAMLVLTVTGVIAHRKIIADFFTFRPTRKARRVTLDLHNLMGVVGLPFYFLFALSGLYIFAGWFAALPMQTVDGVLGKSPVAFLELADSQSPKRRPRAGQSIAMDKAIMPFKTQAEALWSKRYGGPVMADRVRIEHYGDANATVIVHRVFPGRRVIMAQDRIDFDYATGAVLYDQQATPATATRSWLEGLHFVQFEHWPLRWLFFAGGAAGCILTATGALFWMRSREKKAGAQPFNIRFVHAMTVGSVTGIMLATGVFFVANRFIALGALPPGIAPIEWEPITFYIAWLLSFIHAAARGRSAWMDQCFFIAILSLSAAVLNWVTTGDHLIKTMTTGMWSIAGMDLLLLLTSALSAWSAIHLRGKARQRPFAVQGDDPALQPAE